MPYDPYYSDRSEANLNISYLDSNVDKSQSTFQLKLKPHETYLAALPMKHHRGRSDDIVL